MEKGKIAKIDFSEERLARQADKYYNEGKYFSALRLAYRQYENYGGDGDIFARLCDIYEGMNLHGSAINWWFRFLDIADEQDLPDIYEGLAINFLNLGNETQSAFYYNQLIDADASISEEVKMDIVDAFSKDKRDNFRFVYPPKLADYSKEIEQGSRALKVGDCERAIHTLDKVAEGAKGYEKAKELQAVAYLLSGDADQAEKICLQLLQAYPDDVRVLATLSAVYLEQDKKEESKALALRLYDLEQDNAEDLYKVATVCCENGLHKQAFDKFCLLEQKIPYDGRMLYFKAVAAYKCGEIKQAERAFDMLCTVYPDAEVAKYYLQAIRLLDDGETLPKEQEPTYFYNLPQGERESRCRSLVHIGKCPKDEAQLFGLIALHDGYFRWCFDEMDGADHDLQYLALATAAHVRADDFIREVLLDDEVLDILKIETLRMLYTRNEDMTVGIVLCHIYRKVRLLKIKVGRKRHAKFVEAYAKIASKFVAVNETYGKKLKATTESLYRALEKHDSFDLVTSEDDLACAILLLSGIKDLGKDIDAVAKAFDADAAKVRVLMSTALYEEYGQGEKQNDKENTHEID